VINTPMNNYCIDLNIPINPLINGISIDDFETNDETGRPIWILVNLDYINPELKDLFDSKGLVIDLAGLFITREGYPGIKHLDGQCPADLTKINWSYNTNHDMIWYKIKNNVPQKKYSTRASRRRFICYQDDELEEIHRQPVGFPSLVQIGIPHNVETYKGVRKCLTIMLLKKTNESDRRVPVPMSTAKELFAEYLVTPGDSGS
jgi:hypothetical protein